MLQFRLEKDSESEFNKFKPRLKSAKNRFQLIAGLKLDIEYNSKWNHPYLSRVSDLSGSSIFLSSASVLFCFYVKIVIWELLKRDCIGKMKGGIG